MHQLSHLDRSLAIKNGSNLCIDRLLIIEAALILWSYIECGSMYYMLCRSPQYHPNLRLLLKHLVGQYFVSMACRLVQIFYEYDCTLAQSREFDDIKSPFFYATVLRNCLVFIAFSFAPVTMIERLLASFLMADYEKKPRRYISILLIVILYGWAVFCGITFIFELLPTYFHGISSLSLNFCALLACFFNEYYNRRKLANSLVASKDIPNYSLSQRYQISENLKTAMLFKRGIVVAIFFSILCVIMILLSSIYKSDNMFNWIQIGFNYAAIIYGVGIPAAMYYYDENWKRDLIMFFNKWVLRKLPATVNAERSLKSTFGERMIHEKNRETAIYFQQLQQDWSEKTQKTHV
ncbi:unnamed protein product [Caenorhabditis bovis]|uniref:Uncharacterized protein n=1 Tax=Caenorhabditis bovis TaxID=2654633 RepID=A0A8S1ER25_9PELO|nr:unnamed protein product [Caenorhabditis bovis]